MWPPWWPMQCVVPLLCLQVLFRPGWRRVHSCRRHLLSLANYLSHRGSLNLEGLPQHLAFLLPDLVSHPTTAVLSQQQQKGRHHNGPHSVLTLHVLLCAGFQCIFGNITSSLQNCDWREPRPSFIGPGSHPRPQHPHPRHLPTK